MQELTKIQHIPFRYNIHKWYNAMKNEIQRLYSKPTRVYTSLRNLVIL